VRYAPDVPLALLKLIDLFGALFCCGVALALVVGRVCYVVLERFRRIGVGFKFGAFLDFRLEIVSMFVHDLPACSDRALRTLRVSGGCFPRGL
jgi:hypothetical protein